jgi:hypothetical protein
MEKEKKQITEYCFITEYMVAGQLRGGEIWAQNEEEATEFLKQRGASEKILGQEFIPGKRGFKKYVTTRKQ